MGYYRPQGDYYAGYRGDPGIGSFFLGLAKKAVGFIPGVGPALSAVMPGGARTVAAGAITAAAKGVAGRAMGAIVRHPVLSAAAVIRSEEHTSELQSRKYIVCRLLLGKNTNT